MFFVSEYARETTWWTPDGIEEFKKSQEYKRLVQDLGERIALRIVDCLHGRWDKEKLKEKFAAVEEQENVAESSDPRMANSQKKTLVALQGEDSEVRAKSTADKAASASSGK